jgi:hypothetical protein
MESIVSLYADTSYYQRNFKFYMIALFVIIIYIFTSVWGVEKSILIILAISFAIFIVNTGISINKTSSVNKLNDFNKATFIKLQTLQSKINDHITKKIKLVTMSGISLTENDVVVLNQKNNLDSLYIDSTMIYFLYSILPLYEYNSDEFYMLLKGTNNILKIRKEIETYYKENSLQTEDVAIQELPSFRDISPKHTNEPLYIENISEMFEIAIGLKINCLNNIQNIIYNVPKVNKMYKYIDDVLERYSVLISKNLLIISDYHKASIREIGVNTQTKFVSYKGTKGYDRMSNQNIIPTKNLAARSELHQLYV